jgi:hypothetical protein
MTGTKGKEEKKGTYIYRFAGTGHQGQLQGNAFYPGFPFHINVFKIGFIWDQ